MGASPDDRSVRLLRLRRPEGDRGASPGYVADMSDYSDTNKQAASGTADDLKGRLKEAAGSLTGSEGMKQEGRAQQEKGEQESKAAELRAEAAKADARAEAAAAEEGRHQGT